MPSGSPTSGVGRVIAGRYLLLNQLGGGGMGHVWLAHDRRLACEVALKEIVFRDLDTVAEERESRVARARAEARHAAGLRGHPNVVTVHDVLEHEGLPWIVMEYVAGAVDLRDLVDQRGPLAPAEGARVGLAVLDALTAGHERGVMHRDVKPANILLAPDRSGSPYGRVLLTDYGISVRPDGGETRYTMASVLVGTSGYLAPERATGGPPTASADLFSLGCTLYHAVEGQGPFERESHLAQVTAVVMEEPRPAVRAGALGPVLAALLAKDPAERLSATEAEAALSGIITPQAESYARTQTDLGSQPPWAGVAPPPPPPGPGVQDFGPPVASPSVGPSAPSAGSSPARHRREVPRVLRAVLAVSLGLVLALGGVWYAMAHRTSTEDTTASAPPYGSGVGLAEPLKDGDCVLADWPGGRFRGTPRLRVDAGCVGGTPDGQVMAFAPAGSADEARKTGPARCEERTREIRERLADVRAVAVVPSPAGFRAAGRRTACLVLGAHGPVYGPLGAHRKLGSSFIDTTNMQRRDCLRARTNRDAQLVSCTGAYDEKVLGFTRLGSDVTLPEARTESDAACAKDVPPGDYGFDPSVYTAGSWTSEGPWKSGTHFVVCTVRRQNGGTMEGDEP
ncbi:serine/threonine-protein kinase [Streptomyces pseudovenezuelae]|uniref:non-specific serine/threonine protein kinase n=1 Tax=Streptomyces pseudovenezuelae TaxID=67350 RepID=A0ABT6LPG4_9ACTN|nr:serine/threonine-protein kinase [Streptomyces pseudovenezuelae]MDH6218158.1 serine/threonine protein kinase [Streptomyces pseudovenezuelae]